MSFGKYYILLLPILAALSSCRKDNSISIDYKREYYPSAIGHWIEYDVDSVKISTYQSVTTYDTVSYRIREVAESLFRNDDGRPTWRLERYRKDEGNTEWMMDAVWYANVMDYSVERVEENLRFVKLVFPPEQHRSWKGNMYINSADDLSYFDNWDYEFKEVDVPAIVGTLSFDSTLKVIQSDDENLIEKVYFEEWYAKNVGMIYKECLYLSKPSTEDPWREGYHITMRVTDYAR